MPFLTARLHQFLGVALEPVAPWSLAVYRILFGLVGAYGALRFLWFGWVERCFGEPTFFFHFYGFDWIEPMPIFLMKAAFVVMAVAGLMVALGLYYRVAAWTYFLLFSYVELIDVTNYLNHYYLVMCLSFINCWLPLHRVCSMDIRAGRVGGVRTFARWMVWLVRLQVGVVYFYAAIAKAQPDWLLHAQPLSIWLASRTDTPLLGPYLGRFEVALAMSWAGFLYDLTIPFLLMFRFTRVPAFVVVCTFHTLTRVFFTIGLFPLIMTSAALIFFRPEWPKVMLGLVPKTYRAGVLSWLAGFNGEQAVANVRGGRARMAGTLVALYAAFQILMPLRTFLYGGNVLWHEQGMRFSWRVLAREKNASVVFRLRSDRFVREQEVLPTFLTPLQEREMSVQPDLILQAAHEIARRHRATGHRHVEVRVDAFASLNGRRIHALIDPNVDLVEVRDSLLPAAWILPAPTAPPPRVAR